MKSFNSIIKSNGDLEKELLKLKQVVNDPDVKSFLNEHQSELTNEIIDNDLNVLQEYKDQQKIMMGMIMKIVRTLLRVMFLNYISTIIELKYVITCALAKLNTMKKDLILT